MKLFLQYHKVPIISIILHSYTSLHYPPQPLIQHCAHCLHNLPHHIRFREHFDKEILILFITCGSHIGEFFLKKQHKCLFIIIFCIAMPLVLCCIVIFHLEQHLIHLCEMGSIFFIDFLNDNRQWVSLFLSCLLLL